MINSIVVFCVCICMLMAYSIAVVCDFVIVKWIAAGMNGIERSTMKIFNLYKLVFTFVVASLLLLSGCVAFQPTPGVVSTQYAPPVYVTTPRPVSGVRVVRPVRAGYWLCRASTGRGFYFSGRAVNRRSALSVAISKCRSGSNGPCRANMASCRYIYR